MDAFSALLAFCAVNTPVTDELMFPFTSPEPTIEQTMEMPVIWDAIALIMASL